MNYFLAPRSDEKSYQNYTSTLRNGVAYAKVAPFLNEEGKARLLEQEVIYAWGNHQGTKHLWNVMQKGDIVIFCTNHRLVMAGEVYFKYDSRDLALALWPPDENGNPWQYTFFITNIRYLSLSWRAFKRIANFKPNLPLEGFLLLAEDKVHTIEQMFGSMEGFIEQFSVSRSEATPGPEEALHVNLPTDVDPIVITNPVIVPKAPKQAFHADSSQPIKLDYLKLNQVNALLGSKGEELVLREEQKHLTSIGRSDLATQVERVSLEDDAKGYDILSFDDAGQSKYIEVKSSSQQGQTIRFHLSRNEYEKAGQLTNYFIYFVENIDKPRPKITIIPNPVSPDKFFIQADRYMLEGRRQN